MCNFACMLKLITFCNNPVIPSPQSTRGKDCVCELQNSDPAFPENKLKNVEFTASKCTGNITSEKVYKYENIVLCFLWLKISKLKTHFIVCHLILYNLLLKQNCFLFKCVQMTEIDRLVLGLQHRIRQLLDNVSMLEKEDNGNLYAAVSLRIIELELAEIQDLLDKLNRTTNNYQLLSGQTAAQVTLSTPQHFYIYRTILCNVFISKCQLIPYQNWPFSVRVQKRSKYQTYCFVVILGVIFQNV